ncbi:MAG: hypothetical protein FWE01_00175 [Firmicutes bacterium]|nr:hypothetical protein [Bacillota bacterium]
MYSTNRTRLENRSRFNVTNYKKQQAEQQERWRPGLKQQSTLEWEDDLTPRQQAPQDQQRYISSRFPTSRKMSTAAVERLFTATQVNNYLERSIEETSEEIDIMDNAFVQVVHATTKRGFFDGAREVINRIENAFINTTSNFNDIYSRLIEAQVKGIGIMRVVADGWEVMQQKYNYLKAGIKGLLHERDMADANGLENEGDQGFATAY